MSFIRSIRIRYLSGLLTIAVAAAAIMLAMNNVNAYRRQLDTIGADTITLIRDLRNATNFAEQRPLPGATKPARN